MSLRAEQGLHGYLLGRRLHHGLVGAVLLVIGAVLVLDDWADRWWFPARLVRR